MNNATTATLSGTLATNYIYLKFRRTAAICGRGRGQGLKVPALTSQSYGLADTLYRCGGSRHSSPTTTAALGSAAALPCPCRAAVCEVPWLIGPLSPVSRPPLVTYDFMYIQDHLSCSRVRGPLAAPAAGGLPQTTGPAASQGPPCHQCC